VLTWDLIDLLNLVTGGQMKMSPSVCFATKLAQNALVIIIINVRDALMDTTYQEQLATSVMLTVPLAMEEPQVNALDVQMDTSSM